MASKCISNCVNDTGELLARRPTYVNLHRWPESDAAFVRSMSRNMRHLGDQNHTAQPRIVDSISCRQMYLRSYTFSRKESMPEKTKKYFGRVKGKMTRIRRKKRKENEINNNNNKNKKSRVVKTKRKCLVLRRTKEITCAALLSIFCRLLSCTTKIDVADDHHGV